MSKSQLPLPSWVKGPNGARLVKFYGSEPPSLNQGVEVTDIQGDKKRVVVLEVSKRMGSSREPYHLLFTDQSVSANQPRWKGFPSSELGPKAQKQEALSVAESERLILAYLSKNPDRTVREIFHATKTGCVDVRMLNSRIHNLELKGLLEKTKLEGSFHRNVEERGGEVTWRLSDPEVREQSLAGALEALLKRFPEIKGLRGMRFEDGQWDFEFDQVSPGKASP